MGKSSLLGEIARETGVPLVTANGGQRSWPLSGLSAIGASLGGSQADSVDGILHRARQTQQSTFEVADELSRALRAAPAPLRLLIDDIDQLDESSVSVVAYLAGRASDLDLRLVATATSLPSRGPFASFRRTVLEPLARADAIALAAALSPKSTSPGVLTIVATYAGGSPSAIANVRLSDREAAGVDPVHLPLRIGSAASYVWDLETAEGATVNLLRLLALAPRSSVLALTAGSVERRDDLEDLVEAQVVEINHDYVRIIDPFFRSALHAKMAAHERRALHELAARLHAEHDPRMALWHTSFLRADDDPELGLLAVATSFAKSGDIATAIECAERSLTFVTTSPGRTLLLMALSQALYLHGEFSLAQLYLSRSRSEGISPREHLQRVALEITVAHAQQHRVQQDEIDSLVGLYRAVEPDAVAHLLDVVARVHLDRWEIGLAALRNGQSAGLVHERDLEHRLVEQVVRVAGSAESDTLAYRGALAAARFDITAMAALTPTELTLLLRLFTLTEEYDQARQAAAVFLNHAHSSQPVWRESVLLFVLLNELRSGSSHRAGDAQIAWQAALLPDQTLDSVRRLALAGAATFDESLAAETVDALIQDALSQAALERNEAVAQHLHVMKGAQALRDGRYNEAALVLRRAGAGRGDAVDPAILRGDADLIEALWFAGRQGEAKDELDRFVSGARAWPSRWSEQALARARAVCASDADAPAAFSFALSLHPGEARMEKARLRAARERRLPRASADQVPSSPPVPNVLAALDSQELEVAGLVRDGLRNKEIAAALYISQRTVELRLTRIYRKLGILSRARLVALMSGMDERQG